jgi:hypothetical protein
MPDIFVAADILKRIEASTLAWASAPAAKRRRARKPSVATLIKQAEKAGKTVTAITTDGVTLQFGEAKENEANGGTNVNPWDEVLIDAADKKRPS